MKCEKCESDVETLYARMIGLPANPFDTPTWACAACFGDTSTATISKSLVKDRSAGIDWHVKPPTAAQRQEQRSCMGVQKAPDYKLWKIDREEYDSVSFETVAVMKNSVEEAMKRAEVTLAKDLEDAWRRRQQPFAEAYQALASWLPAEELEGIQHETNKLVEKIQASAGGPKDGTMSNELFDGFRKTIDQLTAERDQWKAKACARRDADEQGRAYACADHEGTLHVSKHFMDHVEEERKLRKEYIDRHDRERMQLADKLAISESQLESCQLLWKESQNDLADLRRYIGSKACARYDQLRAKERK